ncbi:MAG TPA: efflux RND transporter permease subunit [Euzebyales bacterium]|nr:efflux RND transporter permease subunit [Euzebyales bacterium]
MRTFTRLALGHRTVTLLAIVLLLVASISAAFGLRQELFPSIEPPFLVTVATQPGAGPVSVVENLTGPIEDAVQSTASLEQVASTSYEGVSITFAEYTYGTDIDEREREVRDALADADLPDGVETPQVTSITPDSLPIYSLALTGDDLNEVTAIAQDELVPELEGLDGVAEATLSGVGSQVVEVTLDPQKLADHGLTPDDVARAINNADLSAPVGAVTDGDTTLPVRVVGTDVDVAAIRNLEIAPGVAAPAVGPGAGAGQTGADAASQADAAAAAQAPPGDPAAAAAQGAVAPAPEPVQIKQLGEVTTAREDTETISRLNGQEAVSLQIRKEQDANTVETVERIEDAIEEVDLPSTVDTEIVVNQAPEITQGVSDVTRDAVLGAILALLMIVVFLRSWRGTIVAGISIPLSLIAALGLMKLSGVTINILTLGALAIAAGRVVDDAIVVLENIYRQLERGLSLREAVRVGASEVTGAVTSATLTAVAVFVPLAFISGLVGEIFIGFALTTTFALLASLLVATSVVPVLGSLLLRRAEAEKADPENSPLRRMVRRPLTWALDHRALTILIAVVLLGGSIASLSQVPINLFPTADAENLVITVEADQGTSLEATGAEVEPLEDRLEGLDGVDSFTTVVGSSSDGIAAAFGGGGGDSTAAITVDVEEGTDTSGLRDEVSAELDDLGLTGSVIEQSAIPTGSEAVVQISGDDFGAVSETASEVEDVLGTVDGLTNLTSNVTEARPELTVDIREDDARASGLEAASVAGLLAGTLNASTATTLDTDSGERDVVVQVDPEAVDSAGELRDLPLPTGQTLGDIADIEEADSPVAITRADGTRSAEVSATITEVNIGEVTTQINAALEDVDPPEGVEVTQIGSNQEIGESFQDLFATQAIAVGLVYLVLVATFGSLLTPFVILLTLPLAAIGAFPALAITGRELGLPAMIGLLMLIGIVITNAIVLLEFVEQRREAGMGLREAVVNGAETRVRPILMTALTTMIGLVPLALGLSEGALLSASLATVVIGGLLSSTLLTLIVIPVVYTLLMGARDRMWRGGGDGEPRDRTMAEPAARDEVAAAPAPAVAAEDHGRSDGRSAPDRPVPVPAEDLTTIARFPSRAQADAALAYLERSGVRVDHIVVRSTTASSRPTRSRLTRLAVQWLREHEPEQLTPPTEPVWELAAPSAYVGAARVVLASNGRAFAPYVRT